MTLGAVHDARRASASEIDLLRVQLDCLPYSTALLDEAGRVLAVNGAWRRFGQENAADPRTIAGVGLDYLKACSDGDHEEGLSAARGIRHVLSGRSDSFELVYASHSPTQMRWYRLTACRPHESGSLGNVISVTHVDATETFIAGAHLRIQAGVARMLGSQVPMLSACRELALSVCHELDWDYAGIWTVDLPSQKLRCRDSWVRPGLQLAAFESGSRAAALGPGVGLPGRAWMSAKAQWAIDLDIAQEGDRDGVSRRRIMPPSAEQAGFRTAVSFPLKCGDEVLAVVDVFSRRRRSPDAALMELLETAGDQLALWELRERAKESARLAQADADDARARLESVLECAPAVVLVIGRDQNIQFINHTRPQFRKEDVVGKPWMGYVLPAHRVRIQTALDQVFATGTPQSYEVAVPEGDHPRWYLNHMGPIRIGGSITGAVVIAQDVTDAKLAQVELHDAQRLASVGTLAAGVAHEINTPVQFVNDSIHFLREASEDLFALITPLRELRHAVAEGAPQAAIDELLETVMAAEDRADLDYLREKVPRAFERSAEGLERVTTIVRSMKEFAHPAQKDMAPTDLNRAIMATLTVARNEYRYVAELETDLGELPPVTCHINDINQVVLNLVVNAAHTIEDVVRGTERRGVISVKTRRVGDDAVISVSDTGTGIHESIRPRIFDPFFTTKEVGRGTGQGLAIARAAVREKHGGDLSFETAIGHGTTFHIRIPLAGKQAGNKQ
jgi:PAS domain S-box-containing protein